MSVRYDYEKPASFYLGKKFDLTTGTELPEKLLYDAHDLTTHGMCVGMTGSGKTGLCISLLEEAALDGVPVIAVDPKGDIGNLALTFPRLRPEDFAPWIDPGQATAAGQSVEEFAAQEARKWRAGLARYDQDGRRISKLREAAEVTIYTPGSSAGVPLTVLKGFAAPHPKVLADSDSYRDRLSGTAAGILSILGIDADPVTSREHILLTNILDAAWKKGRDLDLPQLIAAIHHPPLDRVGVFDLESFYPTTQRVELAMRMNNLLASPALAGWLEGQSLDVGKLLYTADGKPRVSVISIAHLDDTQRMFFVTLLLTELLAWMRSQAGTSTLRAIFYMDEVYGYFPPTAKPPCKPLMMTLLKQARAFGLGILLATQNPVDLDYKGLSNIGTWFIGRLQTERDKARVMEGLEGVAAHAGEQFSRPEMERLLAGLGSRVFLMNNVHEVGQTIFHSRWAMSYLRGPLNREEIRRLMHSSGSESGAISPPAGGGQPHAPTLSTASNTSGAIPSFVAADGTEKKENELLAARPVIPGDVPQRFCRPTLTTVEGTPVVYRPALVGMACCHYVRQSAALDTWLDRLLITPASPEVPERPWEKAKVCASQQISLDKNPMPGASFESPPAELLNARHYRRWKSELRDYIYRNLPLELYYCPELDAWSAPFQSEWEARLHWQQKMREHRDTERERILDRYANKLEALRRRIRAAEQRLERERAQYKQAQLSTVLSIGQTVLGALLGNKVRSRAATATRGLGRTSQQKVDVRHAAESLEQLQAELLELDQQCQQELDDLAQRFALHNLPVKKVSIACRKGDMRIDLVGLLWLPWTFTANGPNKPLISWPTTHGSTD
ncbi:MAG: ATP-binding protein [Pirellulaceae bacterium]|nr:MAG: ATP-binding protein [Pirellulaceae bacterium]